jgi:hypothetical protein
MDHEDVIEFLYEKTDGSWEENVKDVAFQIYKTDANYHSYDDYKESEKDEIKEYFEHIN